jgi:hypothetical protein
MSIIESFDTAAATTTAIRILIYPHKNSFNG